MYIILQRATEINRDPENGMATSWRGTGETIKEFTDGDKFISYVKEHASELKDVVAFTGSASLLQQANFVIGQELKKAGVIK